MDYINEYQSFDNSSSITPEVEFLNELEHPFDLDEMHFLDSKPTMEKEESLIKTRKKPVFCSHYKWSKFEDDLLRELVVKFGENDWRHLAKKMEGRNSRQCRERWQYYLNPNLKVGNWTKEEDELILKKREELGPKWMTIKNFFKNRTDAMIKNRYKHLMKENSKVVYGDMCEDNNLTKNHFQF